MLQVFGVTPTTEAIYRAMLEQPGADRAGLAAATGLDARTLHEGLDELAELRLVELDAGEGHGDGGAANRVVPPEQAVELLIHREEARLAEARERVLQARDGLDRLVDSFVTSRSTRDADGLVERIDDPQVVTSRLFQLAGSARSRVSFVLPGDALPPAALEPSARLDDLVLSRGVALRFVVATPSLGAAHWRDHLLAQVELGLQARSHPTPPSRIVVVDDDVALLTRSDSRGALVLHGHDLVAPVAALFDLVWQDATPLTTLTDDPDDVTDARMHQVVSLLARGQKDEAIARRLGVSVRTVRRLVAAAVAALHAESRFEAGVQAVRRGWVA